MHEKYAPRGVVFIGLTPEGTAALEQSRTFLEDTRITWPNGYGAAETLQRFECAAFPSTWVIGPDGTVIWNEDSSDSLEDGIETALSRLPTK